jgi:hypothetical protein
MAERLAFRSGDQSCWKDLRGVVMAPVLCRGVPLLRSQAADAYTDSRGSLTKFLDLPAM